MMPEGSGRDRGRWPVVAGVLIAAVTLGTYAGLAGLSLFGVAPPDNPDESALAGALWMLSWVPFGLVGAVLVARRPRHPVGWHLAGIAIPIMLTIAIDSVAAEAVARGWTDGWIPWAAWFSNWTYAPVVPLLGLLVATFPTGRVENRLLARLAPVQYGTIAGIAVLRAIRPGPTDTIEIMSPLALPVSRELIDAVIPVVTGFAVVYFLVAGVDLVVRYRRSRGVERAQLKWFAASFGFLVTAFLLLLIVAESWLQDVLGPFLGEVVGTLTFTFGLGGMATAIGVAILRYRLFEIDRIVSRTVTYAGVTGVLVGIYVGLVVGLRSVLPVVGDSDLAVAGTTLVVAALFGPLLRRVRSVVDRRFNRSRYDGVAAVNEFSSRLRDQVALETVTGDLARAVTATLGPSRVSVWVREPSR